MFLTTTMTEEKTMNPCGARLKILWKTTKKIGGILTRESLIIGCIYGFWMTMHWVCAQLYPVYCAPSGDTYIEMLWGFAKSLVISQTPVCVALRYGINHGASTIATIWTLLGTWIVTKLVLK